MSNRVINDIEGMDTALRKYPNRYPVYKFGKSPIVSTTAYPVWDGSGEYKGLLDAVATIEVVSDDANDADAGTGARTVRIQGIKIVNSVWTYCSEDVTLNGLTPVAMTTQFIRIFRAKVLTAGDKFNANLGTIKIYKQGDATTVLAQINVRNGQTLMTIFTVADGYKFFLINADSNIGQGKDAEFQLKVRKADDETSCFKVQAARNLYQNSFARDYKIGRLIGWDFVRCISGELIPEEKGISERTDIVMFVKAEIANTNATSSFEGLLIKE